MWILSEERIAEARERMERFSVLFQAQDLMADVVHELSANLQGRRGEPGISMVVAAALAKAAKSSQAVIHLCTLGFGQDALVVLRSIIDIGISIAYVTGAPDATSRDDRFQSWLGRGWDQERKLRELGFGSQMPLPVPGITAEELRRRAKAWPPLADRATAVQSPDYDRFYRVYSAFDHSDAFALDQYTPALQNRNSLRRPW
jgi:hypothetical protein